MTKAIQARSWVLPVEGGRRYSTGKPNFSLFFTRSNVSFNSRAVLATIPDGFGDGEFALELRIRPSQAGGSIDVGSTTSTKNDRWSSDNVTRYSGAEWWTLGNFLLDGHRNAGNSSGSFDLQLYDSGRLRWLFADSAADARPGDLHAVQGGPRLLDGSWHRAVCVRRWDGSSGAVLELWIDGELVDSESSTARTNMASNYWDAWTGFPVGERNWMLGVEKISALGGNRWERYMGLVDDVRFYGRAPSEGELESQSISSGLIAAYSCDEGVGVEVAASPSGPSMSLANATPDIWSPEGAP